MPEDVLHKRAQELDREGADGSVRGPLQGIPILMKDNIAAAPRLGLALFDVKPKKNAGIVDKVRDSHVPEGFTTERIPLRTVSFLLVGECFWVRKTFPQVPIILRVRLTYC